MFAFAKLFTLLAVASVAVSSPTFKRATCSTGPTHCCDSVADSADTSKAGLFGALPINLQSLGVPLGLNCIPISVIGAGSSGTCSTQSACCSGVDNSGTVPIGLDCSPINLGL